MKYVLTMILMISNIVAGELINKKMTFEGIEREYSVYLPDGWSPEKSYPLIVGFHPFNNTIELYLKVSKMNPFADREGFIMAYPAAAVGVWNNGVPTAPGADEKNFDDMGFVRKMMDQIHEEYNYDLDNAFATGFSSGGFMSYRVGVEMQDRFSAICVMGGAQAVPFGENTKPMPLLIIHSLFDPFVPFIADQGLVGEYSALGSFNGWLDINQVVDRPKKKYGVFKNTNTIEDGFPFSKSNIPYIRMSFKQKEENVGAPMEFYLQISTTHNLPFTLQSIANPTIFEFFKKSIK